MSVHPADDVASATSAVPPLPRPTRLRWQPLRLGLVELFHYDAEEFWFRDGHLLLRGNNGTGKSKVLSLTLPFLLDASLSPVRVEPDGDRSKRMEWNLLMGRYERRLGYTWVEFGRRDEDGTEHYLTLGCGLSAVAGRSRVDAWHFFTDQRVGVELFLITPERTAISRDKLQSAIAGRGSIAETAREYRREVDARLFGLGDRYAGLIDTLIQLRQPQLSKKPDEQSLSIALSNALPELPRSVLEDVADAMNQLAAHRDELAHIEHVRDAVGDFSKRYRRYAQIQARRQARILRQAQTEYDKQSQTLHEAVAQRDEAAAREVQHERRCAELDAEVVRTRAVLDELRADPTMRDASRLEECERAARDAATALLQARERAEQSRATHEHEQEQAEQREREALRVRGELTELADEARAHAQESGIAAEHERAVAPFVADEPARGADGLRRELEFIAQRRAAQVQKVREELAIWEGLQRVHEKLGERASERRDALERAEREARAADQELSRTAARFVEDFRAYLDQLRVLVVPEPEAALAVLFDWAESQDGEQPMRAVLDEALHAGQAQLASARSELSARSAALALQSEEVDAEASALRAGKQLAPLLSSTRAESARRQRPGAPLWELVEFREHLTPSERAGIEAALEGAGLLDAWVVPDGAVLHPDTHDAWLVPATTYARSLGEWLVPGPARAVAPEAVERLLKSIASGDEDPGDTDTWIDASGRFRIGRLQGAYGKPEAQYVGRAAREAARQRRLAELEALRAQLEEQRSQLDVARAALDERAEQLRHEARAAPSDEPLRNAHLAFTAREALRREAHERLVEVEAALSVALERALAARRVLERDANDLALEPDGAALHSVERVLNDYRASLRDMVAGLLHFERARHELARQQERARRSRERAAEDALALHGCALAADEATARRDLLRATVGESVAALKERLHAATRALREGEAALSEERDRRADAMQQRARAEQRVEDQSELLQERLRSRQAAIERLQSFARTGLLAIAAPELDAPAKESWTIDPALTLARRIEASLASVAAEDRDWTRIQDEIGRDYTQLGQALSALGQRASMEQTEYGLVVQIIYGNRVERPDRLEQRLDAEIQQRREALTAQERTVLENHLQAEVAAYLQRLLQEADGRVARINHELKRRPTSTGVYFKLEWEPLAEGDGGAPVGLREARMRLLRRSADAWSLDDRRVVGEFLQQRILAERSASDAAPLVEHLENALDYRRWHRFRVKRWHDGAFRPLAGPASSGERALGLTVPLFAAASSHYESGASPHAPRLVLLDEAFAGIDDEARSHCMALIGEFDLDFVMTSEREWGCYATLPGVAICQIIRREGIDGVFVSRWTWDGRERREAPDPDRRFSS